MEAIEIGDLIFNDGYFMVVQTIDHAYRMYRGNLCASEEEARAHAMGKDPFLWGYIAAINARKVHRLKNLPPAEKICTCTTLDLFRAGCSCGAITPYKQVH